MKRLHVHILADDLDRSIYFYSALLVSAIDAMSSQNRLREIGSTNDAESPVSA
jgi:hypothetical protein